MQTKMLPLALPLAIVLLGVTACKEDAQPEAQYPQQQYPQQQYPQQQYPAATTTATTTTPATTATTTTQGQTSTIIPGVMKNADGTCSVTIPSLNGQPSAPIVGACPPGL